jgi:hypothetical protein
MWTVTQTAAVSNERVAGVTGANPVQLKPYYTGSVIQIGVTAKSDITLNRVAIFGSVDGIRFGPPGSADALCTTATNLLNGEAHLRSAFVFSEDLLTQGAPNLLPEFWLLEYTTSSPGASPTITFEITVALVGDPPFGLE